MQSLFIICHSLLHVILVLQASSRTPVIVSCLGGQSNAVGVDSKFITGWLEKNLFSGIFRWKIYQRNRVLWISIKQWTANRGKYTGLLWMKSDCQHQPQPKIPQLLAGFLIQTLDKIREVFLWMTLSVHQTLFTTKFSSPAQLGMQCVFSIKRLKVKVIQLVCFPA